MTQTSTRDRIDYEFDMDAEQGSTVISVDNEGVSIKLKSFGSNPSQRVTLTHQEFFDLTQKIHVYLKMRDMATGGTA